MTDRFLNWVARNEIRIIVITMLISVPVMVLDLLFWRP